MNTTRLSQRYSALTPAARFSLMLAASARGDEVEHARLVAAAPWVAIRVPDTFRWEIAFREVLDLQRMERLELAALTFQAWQIAADTEGDLAARMVGAARVFGYLLRVGREGWERLCAMVMIRADAVEALLPGGKILRMAEELDGTDGLTADEVVASFARSAGEVTPQVKTAESVAADLTAMFEARLAWWEGI